MVQIIAIANQKGGTGKTTTTLNLGAALREMGNRVLLIDMDPQASLTLALGLDPDELETTIYTALQNVVEAGEMDARQVIRTTGEGLDLIPANIELSQADLDLVREPLGVYALRDVLSPIKATYDYILMDCPPSLGILTTNSLAAADQVIIPLQADYLALKGVNLLLRTVAKIQRRANRRLRIAGVLLTMADLRTLHAREIIATTRQAFDERVPVFETVIRLSVRLKEAPITGQSILAYASDTVGAIAYRELARELTTQPPTPASSAPRYPQDDGIEKAAKLVPSVAEGKVAADG
jgi:chromosome partitioning protein